jgi:hypothetical protein
LFGPRKEEAEAIDEDFDPPENEKAPVTGTLGIAMGTFNHQTYGDIV